jgi:23S rRNA pseudouridine2605 synthase
MTRRRNSPKPQSRPSKGDQETPGSQRLQKVLAAAGVASRRDCEDLIREGRVEVDRQVVTELGTRVDPVAQEIRVDGEPIRKPKRVYYMLNKPPDVVCTNHDPAGRPRVIDLVPDDERVFAVGRLDRASEGLILVTNDGNFANHITHPRYGVEKTYLVRVAGRPGPEQLAKLRRGVHLAEGFCKVESVVVKSRHKQSTDLLIVLDEGRNREIRRILAKVGHKVVRLKRIAIGGLKLGALEPGEWRKLTPAEIEDLLAISRKKRKEKKEKKESQKSPPARTKEDKAAAQETIVADEPSPPPRVKKLKVERSEFSNSKPKPPSAKTIAERLLRGEDFEDDDEDFEEELFDEEELGDDDYFTDEEDGIEQTIIREEIRDDRRPPKSGPVPRGEVIDFDEDSPPPLQSRQVREGRSGGKSERPRTGKRRGQRQRQPEDFEPPRSGRAAQARGKKTPADPKGAKPKRPGKLVVARPQEDRGARGKYPGKSYGKGKKYEGGGRGPKTIFGKRLKRKKRGR